jgi:glycosyltransferase involved in cell wall biosynthesis
LVHVATEGPLGLSALRAARSAGIPVTSTFHTNFDAYGGHYGYGWLARPVRRYLRWFHNRTRVTLVPSGDLRSALSAAGFSNCRVMGRGVDTTAFHPSHQRRELRVEWGLPANGLALLCVGRIAREKNLGLAVRALAAVRRERPDAHLILVGDGPAREDFAGLPGVVVRGLVSQDDLAVHYASADLFVFPSLTETFGNVLCEAMASGLPAVTFDYAAAATHVTHGENGLKVAPGDEEAFLGEVVRAAADPALRARLGDAARRRMLDVGWDQVVDRFETEAREALGSARRRP